MTKHLLCSLAAIVMLASCKKDDNTPDKTAGLEGTYKLKYLNAQTNSTLTGSYGDKVITISDYTTENNQGNIVFNSTTLSATGLAYSVSSAAKYYLYDGTNLIDSASFPIAFTLPPSNSTSQYQLIGADSIYFPQGSGTSSMPGGGTTATLPSGGRYSWNGNELSIKQHVSRDSSFQDSGETYQLKESAITNFVLEKQ